MDNTTNALLPTKKIQLKTQTVQVLRGGSYKKEDYSALKLQTLKHKLEAQRSLKKMKDVRTFDVKRRDQSLLRQHQKIWQNSSLLLKKSIKNMEDDHFLLLKRFMNQFAGVDAIFVSSVERCFESESHELENFKLGVVDPIFLLRKDLSHRLKTGFNSIEGSCDEQDIIQQIDGVKMQSDTIHDWLLQQRNQLEIELDMLPISQSTDIVMPDVKYAIPANAFNVHCPKLSVVEMVMKQFLDIHSYYYQQIMKESDKLENVSLHILNMPQSWNSTELWTVVAIPEMYAQLNPGQEHSTLQSLIADILQRLLQKSKMDVVKISSSLLLYRFINERRKIILSSYYHHRNELLSKMHVTYADACSDHTKSSNSKAIISQQKKVCDQLHAKVEQMRKHDAEFRQIEERAAKAKYRAHLEKEVAAKQKFRSYQKLLHEKIADYHLRKQQKTAEVIQRSEAKSSELRFQMYRQRKYNKERIKFREILNQQKQDAVVEAAEQRKNEEIKKMKNLEILRKRVAVTAEASYQRMVQDTISSRAKAGFNIDCNLQAPLYNVYGFSGDEIAKDVRVRVDAALRVAGVHQSDYARFITSTLLPPTYSRRDNDSSGFKSSFLNAI
ncbi:unnamed protein product [Clavelina lepadiformis]|uniref:Uncharacterized protein n=1 Tax=Clavelina lepadiformis TaxID=159417 RepID=A0ABP0G0E1_CLALP